MMTGMLSCTKLLDIVSKSFARIKGSQLREGAMSLQDCLLSGYALFSLKYPSLLQFDQHFREDIIRSNLKNIFLINEVPSDSQMRVRLDKEDPRQLRPVYKRLLAHCQRSNRLKLFEYDEGRYLVALDGTGYFYSDKVHCEQCCQKQYKDGTTRYYHQMLSASIVHPDQKVVLPCAPEPIMKTDGGTKNDCEHRAAERFLTDFKREHPHLKVIITGDGLYPDGSFIQCLKEGGHRFILVAKEANHKALFEEFRALPQQTQEMTLKGIRHRFAWSNGHAINDSHPDCLVNVLEYWEEQTNGVTQHWVWVTDILLTEYNVYQIMKGGRARHKIENETFNTLKNQGYQFEHNFGHGKKHLSSILAHLMMIAFFVDQLQQLGCKLFAKALARLKSKKNVWERKRSYFFHFFIESLESLWNALAYGHQGIPLVANTS
ncbi:MAG TPA: transposase [Nitrosomonas sp.]|nr:transposase [Nitrosomonas sp.]